MNKKGIINQLIALTKDEIRHIESDERADIKAVTEDQENENLFENTTEEEVNMLTQENLALDDLENRLSKLESINPEISHDHVNMGALVRLNTGVYLISVAFEAKQIGDVSVTGISRDAPLYQKMEGLKEGVEFHLTGHNTEFIILEIQ